MNMKIAKKILAGTLALMSTFTAVSAEPVKSETPSSDSTSVSNKNSEGESTKKKSAKGMAIAAGGAAAVAATVGVVFALIKGVFKTSKETSEETSKIEKNWSLLEISRKVFELYLIPEVRECVEKYKNTELGEALTYLFDVLDGKKLRDNECMKKSLDCVRRYMGIFGLESVCGELNCVLNGRDLRVGHRNIRRLTIDNIWALRMYMSNGQYMHSFYIDSVELSELGSTTLMQIPISENCHFDLKALFVCDEENCCFTTAYIKHEDGKWHRHSFDGINRESFDDNFIESRLENCHEKVNLVYVKVR